VVCLTGCDLDTLRNKPSRLRRSTDHRAPRKNTLVRFGRHSVRRQGLGQAVFERPNELLHAVTCALPLPRPYGSSGGSDFPAEPNSLGVRYLTGGSDVGYILSAGRADEAVTRAEVCREPVISRRVRRAGRGKPFPSWPTLSARTRSCGRPIIRVRTVSSLGRRR
jgi:hypothetical protein